MRTSIRMELGLFRANRCRRGGGHCICPHRRFWEFSLCLSRACLGKIIIFIYKWRKKPPSNLSRILQNPRTLLSSFVFALAFALALAFAFAFAFAFAICVLRSTYCFLPLLLLRTAPVFYCCCVVSRVAAVLLPRPHKISWTQRQQ